MAGGLRSGEGVLQRAHRFGGLAALAECERLDDMGLDSRGAGLVLRAGECSPAATARLVEERLEASEGEPESRLGCSA